MTVDMFVVFTPKCIALHLLTLNSIFIAQFVQITWDSSAMLQLALMLTTWKKKTKHKFTNSKIYHLTPFLFVAVLNSIGSSSLRNPSVKFLPNSPFTAEFSSSTQRKINMTFIQVDTPKISEGVHPTQEPRKPLCHSPNWQLTADTMLFNL